MLGGSRVAAQLVASRVVLSSIELVSVTAFISRGIPHTVGPCQEVTRLQTDGNIAVSSLSCALVDGQIRFDGENWERHDVKPAGGEHVEHFLRLVDLCTGIWLIQHYTGCFKKSFKSKCCCVASVTKTFTLKGVQTIHR
jgi:hypothetical protein